MSVPRRLLADLQWFSRHADIDNVAVEPPKVSAREGTSAPTDGPTLPSAAMPDVFIGDVSFDPLAVSLEGVSVALAYRFMRVCADGPSGFTVWRPVFGAESDHSEIFSPVQLEDHMRSSASWASDEDVVALPLGDVLCEGAHVCSRALPPPLCSCACVIARTCMR